MSLLQLFIILLWSPSLTLLSRSAYALSSPCLWFSSRFITVNIFHRLCAVKERDLCKIYARPLSLKEGQIKKDRLN